ncbi:MAG: anhydro-N-acetylmuramic acid kinase [Bacteroidota bacterium]
MKNNNLEIVRIYPDFHIMYFSLILVINNQQWLELNNVMAKSLYLTNGEEWFSKSRYVIGIMTGTSVDSVDIVLSKFIGAKSRHFLFSMLYYDNFPLSVNLKTSIENAIANIATTREIAQLNFELAYFFVKTVKTFLEMHNFPIEKVNAIGVHGQTVWHEPHPKDNPKNGFTFQLVSLGAMAQLLKIPIVGDFRTKDIAVGGEGAPLVPIFDYEFLASKEKDVVALNIGGIANITYIPTKAKLNNVVAFDTGPGNVLIDGAMKLLFNQNLDKDGETARKGKLNNAIFKKLKSIPFVRQKPPKSTGREYFNSELLREIIDLGKNKKLPGEDIITTLTHYTAWSVAENIKLFANRNCRLIVSGGGARNKFLMELLSFYLPETEIMTSDKVGIPVQAKEALAFAFLAYLRMGGLPSNIPSVTGARERVSLGIVAI